MDTVRVYSRERARVGGISVKVSSRYSWGIQQGESYIGLGVFSVKVSSR